MTNFQFWLLLAVIVRFSVPTAHLSWMRNFLAALFVVFAFFGLVIDWAPSSSQGAAIIVQPK